MGTFLRIFYSAGLVRTSVSLHAARGLRARSVAASIMARALYPSPLLARALPALTMLAVAACDDSGKDAQARAAALLPKLEAVVQEDVAQLRRGLPLGAQKLASLLDPDPGANLQSLQRAILDARSGVRDLNIAKSTFFSFTDLSGVVLRSEAETDILAGKSVLAAFPSLKAALEPTSGVVEVYGEMPEMRGVRTGPDHQWVLAHPVKGDGGAVKGMFVTGWSFRRYAAFLEDQARRELQSMAQKAGEKKLPLAYVFIVKGGKAYGAPVTPDVTASAVEKLDLAAATNASPYQTALKITNRTFGLAAARAPGLGEGAVLAVLLSNI